MVECTCLSRFFLNQMFNFYILVSLKTGRYYIGSTGNIENRFKAHNLGRVTSTKSMKPWKLAFTKTYDTLSGARRMEANVKGWKSRKAIEKLIKNI